MVSFRLSHEEYESLTRICFERGLRSISEMARIALQNLADADFESDPLAFEVRDLRSQLQTVAQQVERFSEIVEARNAPKVGA